MAGTIPNLPLSTQFDKDTGLPLRGGKLFFFQAGTIATPQLAFKDTGLLQPHPNPITLDGAGRIPSFFLADGSIHVRLTNAQGVTQFEELSLLVVGPSSGGGGGGGSVDPTSLFQTGDVIWLDQSGTRSGWVRDNGRTIGSATSGASERANSDCQSLYTFLWNTYSSTICPVNGGRGANAAADWAANKWITLPDKRGYAPGGLDDMGNSAANRYTGVPFASGNATTAGSVCGEATHTLTENELPSLTKTTNSNGDHSHFVSYTFTNKSGGPDFIGGSWLTSGGAVNLQSTTAGAHTHTVSFGGGASQNITDNRVLGTFYRKL